VGCALTCAGRFVVTSGVALRMLGEARGAVRRVRVAGCIS